MKIISYISKQWSLRWRDFIIATLSAAFTAAGTFFFDQFQLLGTSFNLKQTLGASLLVFAYHIGRKLLEPHKIITMQKLDKEELPIAEEVVKEANDEGTVPPPIGDPTHPTSTPPKQNPPPPIGDPTHPPKD